MQTNKTAKRHSGGSIPTGIDPPDNIQHHERLIVDLIRPATTWIEAATDG